MKVKDFLKYLNYLENSNEKSLDELDVVVGVKYVFHDVVGVHVASFDNKSVLAIELE